MRFLLTVALCAGALVSCAHVGPAPLGPEAVARAYAEALEQGRVEAAFELSTGLDAKQFAATYSDAAVRARRAALVRAAADGGAGAEPLALTWEPAGWRIHEHAVETAAPGAQEQAAKTLTRFLDAAESGAFDAALPLLASNWRARYSPERFAEDFSREPLARERLERARAALAGGRWVMAADGAQLPLGEGRAVRLTHEGDGYKVAALE